MDTTVQAPPEPKKCTCGEPATMRAGKSGRRGTDLCERCWRLDYQENE